MDTGTQPAKTPGAPDFVLPQYGSINPLPPGTGRIRIQNLSNAENVEIRFVHLMAGGQTHMYPYFLGPGEARTFWVEMLPQTVNFGNMGPPAVDVTYNP
jgi:hypothetical protein